MTAIIWSPQALKDLESIREYIAQDSARYAELVVARIVSSVERLSSFPESGRVVPELNRPDVREVIVRPYRVLVPLFVVIFLFALLGYRYLRRACELRVG